MPVQDPGPSTSSATNLLRRFIAGSLVVAGGLIVANTVAFFTLHSRIYLHAAAAAALVLLALGGAWRLAGAGRLRQAVLLVSSALLSGTLATALIDPGARPLLSVLPLLASTLALPFISGRSLARLLALACLVSVGTSLYVELVPAPSGVPAWLATPLRVVGLALVESVVAVLLWHLGRWLHDTIGRLENTSEELRVSRANMQALVDNAPDIIVRLDRSLRHVYVNPALERATGLPPHAFLGRTSAETGMPGAVVSAWEQAYREALDTGRERVLEYELERDGGTRLYEARVVPERGAAGETISLLVVTRDLTDRRRAEEQRRLLEAELRNRQKLESLSVLTGGVAHDFNNLLGVILGNTELALMDLEPDAPARASVEPIAHAARRAGELTRQMLSFAGRGRALMQPTDITAVLDETAPLLRAALPPEVRIEYQHACCLPLVQADAQQLRQVIVNLVVNAAEAMTSASPAHGASVGGCITVASGVTRLSRAQLERTILAPELPDGEYVVLEVGDTGAGMDDATRERIFEPFFTTRFVGRGLGMPAVLGIVQAHRGAIRVESSPGDGTVITVLLPAAGSARLRRQQPSNGRAAPPLATPPSVPPPCEERAREVSAAVVQTAR